MPRLEFRFGLALFIGALAPVSPRAAGGDQLWRFYADFAVKVAVPIEDLSGNGGKDVLAGSQDDTLYLVEGKGPKAGNQLWSTAFKSTLSAAAEIGDVNGDGKSDVAAGDELGFMQLLSGASGAPIWQYLTFGTVLSVISIPDVNGDGKPDAVFGSENDTVYCMSSKAHGLGQVEWRFGLPAVKTHPGPGGPGSAAPKTAVGRPTDVPAGANSLALLHSGPNAHGIVVGGSNDTVYCLPVAGGTPKWKTGMPGDVWKVVAFPDQDGDGIEEVLLACGADIGYLLKGSDGTPLWSHAVSMGAVSVAVSPDGNGDGKPDALIGDGGGKLHCVPGTARGTDVAAAWTYDFGDTSTITGIAPLGDLDGDGRSEAVVGTSNDMAALVTGTGAKGWAVNMGGEVNQVGNMGDVDGNGKVDAVAGAETGYASVLSGGGAGVGIAPRPLAAPSHRGAFRHVTSLIRLRGATGAWFDGEGRLLTEAARR